MPSAYRLGWGVRALGRGSAEGQNPLRKKSLIGCFGRRLGANATVVWMFERYANDWSALIRKLEGKGGPGHYVLMSSDILQKQNDFRMTAHGAFPLRRYRPEAAIGQ